MMHIPKSALDAAGVKRPDETARPTAVPKKCQNCGGDFIAPDLASTKKDLIPLGQTLAETGVVRCGSCGAVDIGGDALLALLADGGVL